MSRPIRTNSKAFTEKYRNSKSINEKIEILERIKVISLNINNDHSLFALEEASIIEDEPNLTYAQRLRLKWLPGLTPEDESRFVAELLPQTYSSFEMAMLALITDFCSNEERVAVIYRYIAMVDAAVASDAAAELGNLLALAACWNNSPFIRPKLTEVANKIASIEGFSLPEKRVNHIVAEIYAQIDTFTGKYENYDYIPA